MRRLLLLVAILIGVAAVKRHWARRAEGYAQDEGAQANWENEGGAPAPGSV